MPATPERLTIWVTGDVQGVGFRWWVREHASAAGLAGSATNRCDGSVEIIVEGTASACAELLAQVEGGTAPGRARSVTHRWGPATGMTRFTVG